MRILRFILLVLVTLAAIGAAVLLTIDGNLSRIIGRTAFSSGERLFPYTKEEMNEISWMRINCGGDMAEFRRRPNGVWWGEKPWDDRMDPRAAAAILQYTYSTSIVDALPLHKIDSASLKEFGVKTTPITITLKEMSADGRRSSTMARYTLGSTAPWLVDDTENQTTDDTTYMQTDFYGRDSRILVGTGNILPLFKSGIRQLRDHRPLLIHPAMPASIEINNKGQRIALERPSPDPRTPWKITYPLPLDTDPQMMDVLLGTLQKLTAVRVYDPEETSVPDMTDDQVTSVSIRNFTGRLAGDGKSLAVEEKPVTLRIYPPSDNSNLAELVKATVSDRKAVFELAQTTGSNKEVPGVPEHSPGPQPAPLQAAHGHRRLQNHGAFHPPQSPGLPDHRPFCTGRRKDRPAAHMDVHGGRLPLPGSQPGPPRFPAENRENGQRGRIRLRQGHGPCRVRPGQPAPDAHDVPAAQAQ